MHSKIWPDNTHKAGYQCSQTNMFTHQPLNTAIRPTVPCSVCLVSILCIGHKLPAHFICTWSRRHDEDEVLVALQREPSSSASRPSTKTGTSPFLLLVKTFYHGNGIQFHQYKDSSLLFCNGMQYQYYTVAAVDSCNNMHMSHHEVATISCNKM